MVRPSKFEIKERGDRQNVTLSVSGELDMRTSAELSERLAKRLADGAESVMLDLHALAFMDSCGLRLLIELYDRSRQDGWRLTLICPEHEAAALVLRATGADRALPFVKAGEE
jgi:anti-sigma B factor antagonist